MQAVKTVLSTIWKYWKKFGEFIGNIIGRLFLMLFYVTIALPFGLGTRLASDPLHIKAKAVSHPNWHKRESGAPTIEASYNQF
jgi:hypothetical protein